MKTIKPFIDYGWFTVPLHGQLKRLANGKKSIPDFPKDFKEKFAKQFNNNATELGGVITGSCSGIIAIDCDNTTTYKIFKALDPDYACEFVSIGKKDPQGNLLETSTIIYKYTEELSDGFFVRNDRFNLDFYSSGGFIYLPTESNETKKTWAEIIEPKEVPSTILALLKSLKPVRQRTAEVELRNKTWVMHLAPQLKTFITNKTVTKSLFKILTPKDFRDTEEYLQEGFCHPKNIVDGRGSEYLMKVSAILGADESVDEELYTQAMHVINGLFTEPMTKTRFSSTIIEPMIEERAKVDGQVIWRYNKDWEANVTILVTKLQSSLHVFYDMFRRMYYAIDITNERVHEFNEDTQLYSFLEAVAVDVPAKKELKSALPLVSVVSTPKYQFGFFGENKGSFNMFIPTIPLMVFKNPESYEKNYTYPATFLAFLESLIPDDYMRNYFIGFLRRKLDKFEYSPVVLYFLGRSGSGKDILVRLLTEIIGPKAIAKPSASEFIEKHNGWILDKYFAHLDEYGDQLTKFADAEVAKGLIKAYSGKSVISIREMRTDGFSYEHNMTLVMTANKNPVTFDDDDRRIALFDTPNKLSDSVENLELFVSKLFGEINDFMYWLSVCRENVTADEYMLPPETASKKLLIASKLNAGAKIAYYLSNELFEDFEELVTQYDCPAIFNNAEDNKIYEDDLFDLYMELTENEGTKRGLTMAMKKFDKIPTTRNGSKAYYYRVPGFRRTSSTLFSPIAGDV